MLNLKKSFLMGGAATGAALVASAFFSIVAVQAACTNPSTIPAGFTAPCPVFSLSATTVTQSQTLTLSATPQPGTDYIYTTSYVSQGSNWNPYTLAGNNAYPSYSSALASLTLSSTQLQSLSLGTHYAVVWDWLWDATAGCYKGPGLNQCNTGAWRVQSFNLTSSATPTPTPTPTYTYSQNSYYAYSQSAYTQTSISLVQTNSIIGSGTTASVAFPSNNTTGNLIAAFVFVSGGSTGVTLSDARGNVYTLAKSQTQTTDGTQIKIFYAPNVPGGTNTVTANASASAARLYLAVFEYAGLASASPLDKIAGSQGASTAPSSGSITTAQANELLFGGLGLPGNYTGTITAGTGYALKANAGWASAEDRVVSSAGSYAAPFTLGVSANWSAALVTFKGSGTSYAYSQSSYYVYSQSAYYAYSQSAYYTYSQSAYTGGNAIPASLFGMHNMQYSDWPTFSIGALGKGTQVLWPYIEYQHGSYDWSLLDNYVNSAESHGLAGTMFFTNDTFPQFATSNTGSCYDSGVKVQTVEVFKCTAPPSDWSYFDSFWTAIVQRYGTRLMYEAFNEFNTPEDYSGTTAQLITLVQHFHDVIRANCPACKIGSPNSNGQDQSITDQIFASGSKAQDVDFITFHSYYATPEELATIYLKNIQTVAVKYPALAAKPFYDTEGSWGSYSPSDKAGYIARAYLMLWSKGASRFYWYAWDNSAWGNLKGNSALMNAYQQTYNWMVGSTMSTPCAASGTVWTCGLTSSTGAQEKAVWNTAGSSSYTVPAGFGRYKDLAGNTTAVGGTVTIGTSPILLVP